MLNVISTPAVIDAVLRAEKPLLALFVVACVMSIMGISRWTRNKERRTSAMIDNHNRQTSEMMQYHKEKSDEREALLMSFNEENRKRSEIREQQLVDVVTSVQEEKKFYQREHQAYVKAQGEIVRTLQSMQASIEDHSQKTIGALNNFERRMENVEGLKERVTGIEERMGIVIDHKIDED